MIQFGVPKFLTDINHWHPGKRNQNSLQFPKSEAVVELVRTRTKASSKFISLFIHGNVFSPCHDFGFAVEIYIVLLTQI
jgi:hypothetical protein